MPDQIKCIRCGEMHAASINQEFARVYSCPDEPPAIVLEQPDRIVGGVGYALFDDEMALDFACALLAECDPAVLERLDRHMATAVARVLDGRKR